MPNSSRRVFLGEDFKPTKSVPKYVQKILVRETYAGVDFRELMKNEITWLWKLVQFPWAPKIVSVEGNTITMEYVGERVCVENLPANWRAQMEAILNDLKSVSCFHNDIKNEEILVKDGRLHLIDFQHATSTREEFRDKKISGVCKCRMSWTDHDGMLTVLDNIERKLNADKQTPPHFVVV